MLDLKTPFAPADSNISRTYVVDIIQNSMLGGKVHENKIFLKVQKERVIMVGSRLVNNYQLNVLERKATSAHPLRELENEIENFKSSLVITPDKWGRPAAILNRREIQDRWQRERDRIRRKFAHLKSIDPILLQTNAFIGNRDAFLETFLESDLATVLFPPIYGESVTEIQERTEKKTFTDFIGDADLPMLLTVTDYKKTGGKKGIKHHLKRKGKVDAKTYDAEKVKHFFERMAGGTAQMQTALAVEYKELYDLDDKHWITHAGQLFRAEIKGLFSYQQIIRVRPLTE